jgi:3D (Asp-Asp-Asp) domain-containing protein
MSRPTENTDRLILSEFIRIISTVAHAGRSMHRSTVRIAAFGALLAVACCFARSDARIETDPMHDLGIAHVVGTWNGHAPSNVVASAQRMLTSTKIDDTSGMQAHVAPLNVDIEVHARRVPMIATPETRFSAHMAPGERRTLRPGTPGYAWITERITRWNDVVVDRQVISSEVVRRGTPAVVLEGTPKTLAQLRQDPKYRGVASAYTMVATAYTADTATAYPTGYTATGILARQGIVAVDPRVIPLGSTVFVPGYGIAIAADTGGAIVGNRIDLCMDSYGDAVNFGRQTVQVYLLKR